MPDYIMRWLASRFGDADLHEELGILTPEVRARKAAEEALMRGDTAGPAAAEPDATAANGHANGGNGHATPSASASRAEAGGRGADRRAAARSRRSCRAWSWARPARSAEA